MICQKIMNNENNDYQTPTGELARAQMDLDSVPTRVDSTIVARSGNTERYLVGKCKEYGITNDQLNDIVDMRNEYGTSVPAVLGLLDNGYTLDEVRGFLAAREELKTGRDAPSLKQLGEFYRTFNDLETDGDDLADRVQEVHDQLGYRNIDTSLKAVREMAEHLRVGNLETVLHWQTNRPLFGVAGDPSLCFVTHGEFGDDYGEDSHPLH